LSLYYARFSKCFKGKITATVGRAFDQTHPDGIEFFRARKADLRIFRDGAVLFHPKVYLFSSAGRVALFVGSSNFTFSGFYTNAEINVLIEGPAGSPDAHRLDELLWHLKAWHSEPLSFIPSDAWLADYRKKFALNQQAQKRSPVQTPLQYEEQVPPASWLTNATWDTYYQKVLDGLEEHDRDKQEMLDFFVTVRKNLPLPDQALNLQHADPGKRVVPLFVRYVSLAPDDRIRPLQGLPRDMKWADSWSRDEQNKPRGLIADGILEQI